MFIGKSLHRSTPLLLVLALFVGACGSSSDDESGGDTAASSTTTEASGNTEAPDEPATTVEGSAGDEGEENFDSFRGVTADTIKVGFTVPDYEALAAAGVPNNYGDMDVAFQAFVDVINAEGGIHGRMIEPVYVGFDWLTPATQDTACIELTEVNEVFIVLGGLLAENNLCLTDVHETMVMTDGFQTTALREQSGSTLWLSTKAAIDEATRILGATLAESGRLDDKTIGIIGNGSLDGGTAGEVMQATLAEYGFESSLVITTSPLGDELASDAELAVIAERFKTDGIDFVFTLSSGSVLEAFAAAGYDPEVAVDSLDGTISGTDDKSLLEGIVGVGELGSDASLADPDFRSMCVDVLVGANPDLDGQLDAIPSADEQLAGTKNWYEAAMFACTQTRLLKMLGEIAGADLTNDSFLAALDELGPVDLAGFGQVSFRSDKWDGLDEFYLQTYDSAAGGLVLIGDSIIVDR